MTTRRPPRPPRWDRRESDGAAWLDAAALAVQQDHAAPQIARKRRRFSATFSPLLNREPFPGVTADLRRRLAAAGRTATVNFAIFAALVFSGQKSLPAAWVGNVLAVTALKDTLGETFLFARSIVLSMVPVSVSCCAVGYILGRFDDLWYSILLPGVVLVGSLIVVLCPQLPNKNLMLVILYLTVASPLSSKETVYLDAPSKDLGAWFSVRLAGTCVVGLSIAVMLHLSLKFTPNSTTAHRMTDRLIWRLRFETEQLLRAVLQYTQNIGVATLTARKSRTMIEFYICSRGKTISKIEQLADAVKAERVFGEASIDCTKLKKFIECAKKQQRHTEMIRQATAEEFLGEEYTSHNENVKSIKTKISTNLGFALDCLVAEFCRCERDFLDFRHTSAHQDCSSGLAQCMDLYRQKMKAAIEEAEQMLDENEEAKRQTAGPLVRSRVVFLGVSSFVREFQDLTAATSSDKMEAKVPGRSTNLTALMSQLKSQMTLSWPWKNVAKRRLAVKTSVGLCVASLWVSIPYYPSGIWPGITVASISLSTSGASYVKSLDRLWGTLVAAAFSLLLTSAVESEIATLLLMTVFAFASIMVSNPDREYASRYAATSVGSILYGSVENNMDVRQYAPLRVMLIFVGVAIFLFVELVIFPRSSRTVVQAKSLEFFEHLEVCLTDCSNLLSTIGSQPEVTAEDSDAFRDQITANPLWMLKEGQDSVDLAGSLSESVKAVKETFSAFKIELGPGLVEPVLGLNVRLDRAGYERLLQEQRNCLVRLDHLLDMTLSLNRYYKFFPRSHPIRYLDWPTLLSTGVVEMAHHLSATLDRLREVFPNGLLRPSRSTTVLSMAEAVSTFRFYEEHRLTILKMVENRYGDYIFSGSGDAYTPGFRVTLALAISSIIGVAQSLQKCGMCLEKILQSFPTEDAEYLRVKDQSLTPGDVSIQFGSTSSERE